MIAVNMNSIVKVPRFAGRTPFSATAISSWASAESDPCDIAPLEKRVDHRLEETKGRPPIVNLAATMALGATALAIEPEELQRELAIERWWAWALAGVGVVVTLAALQAPRERRKAVVDVA
jgi:hypothetical protein